MEREKRVGNLLNERPYCRILGQLENDYES